MIDWPRRLFAGLFLVGLTASVLAVSADWIGIGASPGFGGRQATALGCGVTLCLAGFCGHRSRRARAWVSGFFRVLALRSATGPAQANAWPQAGEIGIVAALALVLVATDIGFSQRVGLLAHPPYYDGISYMCAAKALFYYLGQPSARSVDPAYPLLERRVPLWQMLMVGAFFVLGEGEWQAYIVRFWPTFLLLLLVLWVVRRRGGWRLALAAMAFTSLLPTLSVGLRASAADYFTGSMDFNRWYLADLRPDLLFAALLLWSVVPLIEHAQAPDRRSWLVSGGSAGLALLCKSSASPMLFLAWGLAVAFVLVVNRRQFVGTIVRGLWALLPFGIALLLWIWSGGAAWAVCCIRDVLAGRSRVYSIPESTLVKEVTYYWNLMGLHMGHVESWLILGSGLMLFAAALWRAGRKVDRRPIGYLALSAALYGLVTVTSAKNYFLGLPYYFLLWIFSWAVLASGLKRWADASPHRRAVLVLVSCAYAGVVILGGFYALWQWPAEEKKIGQKNREVTMRLASDLKRTLTARDLFAWAPAFGYPAALQYYMIGPDCIMVPSNTSTDYPPEVTPAQFIASDASRCKAILVYMEDIEEVSRFFWCPASRRPYLRALAEWVRGPDSCSSLYATYRLSVGVPQLASYRSGDGNRRTFELALYVRDPGKTRLPAPKKLSPVEEH